jgi:hypothetical protein
VPLVQELFAFVGENEHGSRFAASFAYDQNQQSFTLWKEGGSVRDVNLALEVLLEVNFSPGKGR